MPTYSYACTECSNRFDIVQSFTDETLSVCPECSGKLRKLFNSVGIVFKGSGFYRTDSRSGANTASEAAGTKSDSAPAKSDSAPAKSDSAPAKSDSTPAKSNSATASSAPRAPAAASAG